MVTYTVTVHKADWGGAYISGFGFVSDGFTYQVSEYGYAAATFYTVDGDQSSTSSNKVSTTRYGGGNATQIRVTGDMDLWPAEAPPAVPYTYSVTSSTGGSATIDGGQTPVSKVAGSTLQLEATSSTGYHFVKWTVTEEGSLEADLSTTASYTVDSSPAANATYKAYFAINLYTVSFEVASSGHGNVSIDEILNVEHGSTVSLNSTTHAITIKGYSCVPQPDQDYVFRSWSRSPFSLSLTSNITDDTTFTVTFNQQTQDASVSLTVSPANSGTALPSSGSGYQAGYAVTVTGNRLQVAGDEGYYEATPAAGYQFDYWTLNGTRISSQGTLISGQNDIVAVFKQASVVSLTVEYNQDTDGMSVNGTSILSTRSFNISAGSRFTIEATIPSNRVFYRWYGISEDAEWEDYFYAGDPRVSFVGNKVIFSDVNGGFDEEYSIELQSAKSDNIYLYVDNTYANTVFTPLSRVRLTGSQQTIGGVTFRNLDGERMTVIANGTASSETTGVLYCQDQFGRNVNVVVTVVAPSEESNGDCYLSRYDRNGLRTTLELPNIQSIEEQNTATLTEISTIIYGFDDNFVMDLGTTQRYTITLKRNTPKNVQDDEVYSHSANWSNGHWYQKLMDLITGWQNLNWGFVQNTGNQQVFAQTGGFHFHYEPSAETAYQGVSYANLYPVIDENVFIAGNISMSYSGTNLQTLNISIPLAVSTMVRNQNGQPMREVTFHPNLTGETSFKQLFPVGIKSVAPGSVPSEWLSSAAGAMLKGWRTGPSSGTMYSPGGLIPATISDLYAVWSYPYYALADDGSVSGGVTYSVPEGLTSLTYILVGCGGLGGKGLRMGAVTLACGGGGGSGGYRTGLISLTNTRYGRVTSIKLKAATNLSEESTLTLVYGESSTPHEYSITIDNGVSGTYARMKDNRPTPGEGGSGGTNGTPGEDGTLATGGAGGDLSEYINNLVIHYSGGAIPGGGTIPSGDVPPTGSYTSSHTGPTCGAGHDGISDSSSGRQGADGLVIVCLFR